MFNIWQKNSNEIKLRKLVPFAKPIFIRNNVSKSPTL